MKHFTSQFNKEGGVLLVDFDREREMIRALGKEMYQGFLAPFEDGSGPRVLVIGDSMANDAFLSLAKLRKTAESPAFSLRVMRIDDECMKVFEREIESESEERTACPIADNREQVMLPAARSLIENADIIIVSAKWQESTYDDGYNLAAAMSRRSDARIYLVGTAMFQDTTSISMKLAKSGIKPEASRTLMFRTVRFDRLMISDRLRDKVNADPDLNWIEKIGHFCDMDSEACTIFYPDGEAMIRDGAHLTVRAYDGYARFLLEEVGLTDHQN